MIKQTSSALNSKTFFSVFVCLFVSLNNLWKFRRQKISPSVWPSREPSYSSDEAILMDCHAVNDVKSTHTHTRPRIRCVHIFFLSLLLSKLLGVAQNYFFSVFRVDSNINKPKWLHVNADRYKFLRWTLTTVSRMQISTFMGTNEGH